MARGVHGDPGGTGGLAAAISGTWRGDVAWRDDKPKPVIRCGNTAKNCRVILRDGKKQGDLCGGCQAGPNPFKEEEEQSAAVHAAYKASRSR
ncbi:MAG TPA: hypothetical protein VMU11_01440 [Verrucomicrobiae bacterium]|nr:hypothetical protein [Verrucomicrobiae bacterium]